MKRHMDSASWSWKEFKDYYFPGGKRVVLTRRDRSIQRTVDLLEAMEEESNSGDRSSPSTSDRIPKLPSASLAMRRDSQEIQTPRIPTQALLDYFNSLEAPGIDWFPSRLPEDPTIRDRFISPKPISDPLPGSKDETDGDTGPHGTEDSAEDSDGT